MLKFAEILEMPIKWHLRRVMAEKRWTNRALADAIGLHETSVSRLKKHDTMPRIDAGTLEALCRTLEVEPGDLLELVSDE
jgi:putative transcriptional regulator